jgi:hypothetical protein
MELIVSLIGILLCKQDMRELRFFMIAFVIKLFGSVYMRILNYGGVLKMLHDMNYDMSGNFVRFLIWLLPLIMSIGFYVFLLLGIAKVKSEISK